MNDSLAIQSSILDAPSVVRVKVTTYSLLKQFKGFFETQGTTQDVGAFCIEAASPVLRAVSQAGKAVLECDPVICVAKVESLPDIGVMYAITSCQCGNPACEAVHIVPVVTCERTMAVFAALIKVRREVFNLETGQYVTLLPPV